MRWIILKLVVVASLLMIPIGVVPGGFNPGYIWIILLFFLVFGVGLPFLVGVLLTDLAQWLDRKPVTPRGWIPAAIVLSLTLLLLASRTPCRIGFALCVAGFASKLNEAPGELSTGPVGFQIGPYRVDSYASDPAGGVFFRTGTVKPFLETATWSHGFAYRPNERHTPFGHTRLRLEHLQGDWYVFRVRDTN
jgi:hypothetical protein